MDLDNDLHESTALPDLSGSQNNVNVKLTKKNNKRKRKKTKQNAVEIDANSGGTQENTFSSKTATSALDMPPEHPVKCMSSDSLMSQSCVEADICMHENEEKGQSIPSQAVEQGNGECDIQDKGCNCNTVVADAELFAKESVLEVVKVNMEQSINDNTSKHEETSGCTMNESQVKNHDEDLDVELKKKNKKRKKKAKQNVVESNANSCGTPENTFSSKTSTSASNIPPEHPIQCVSTDALTNQSCVDTDICLRENEEKEQNILRQAAEKGNGECNILSQAPENTFSSKTSTSASDIPSEHPIQCASTDSLVSQSCVEADICMRENEEKEQSILSQAAEKGNGEYDILDNRCKCNSVIAEAELFAKESVLAVVKMNMEQSINDNTANHEETSGSTMNESLVKNHDEDLEAHDLCDKSQCIKTYSRKKLNNVICSRILDCSSPVNSNKEPTMQDQHNDDSHKVSDGPLTNCLMERETEPSIDLNKVEHEEMELKTENSSEQSSKTTSSVVDISATQLEETNARQVDHAEVTRNDLCCPGDVSDLSLVSVKDGKSQISQVSVERTIISNSKNKLLILDVNGLLADCVSDVPNGYYTPEPDFWVRRRKVYKRPFCDDFLQFCFDRFHVGVWSSRAKCNVDEVIKCLMGKSASRLLFCWSQTQCTTTNFSTVENREKPLVLKELRKLWEKLVPGLPWEKGEFHEANTLLLDDSPYKALVNPKHTAIFPFSYRHYQSKDSSLGPKGDLRAYLERLAMADNVQEFVAANEFGQRPIREANPSWGYYLKVIESVKGRENGRPSAPFSH